MELDVLNDHLHARLQNHRVDVLNRFLLVTHSMWWNVLFNWQVNWQTLIMSVFCSDAFIEFMNSCWHESQEDLFPLTKVVTVFHFQANQWSIKTKMNQWNCKLGGYSIYEVRNGWTGNIAHFYSTLNNWCNFIQTTTLTVQRVQTRWLSCSEFTCQRHQLPEFQIRNM